MTDVSPAALAAMSGLRAGEIEPLAIYLASQLDGNLDPLVVRALLQSIIGSHEHNDFRMMLMPHPDIKHHKQSRRFKSRQTGTEIDTALAIWKAGGNKRGYHDAAITQVMNDKKLSHGAVTRHWKNQRKFIRFCIAHGVIQDPCKV